MAKSKSTASGNGVSETPNLLEVLTDNTRYLTKEQIAKELGGAVAGVEQRIEKEDLLRAGIITGNYPNTKIRFWRFDSAILPAYFEAVASGKTKPLRQSAKPRRYSTDLLTIEQRTRANEFFTNELGVRPLVSLHSQEYAIPRTSADEPDTDAAEPDGTPVSSDFEPAYAS
jgi:hypothetical protein